ncbi:MAG: STAS domain-containing protein [Solirubrobacterales bacterium]|nr:STAS domain-containing protein [Solirubrobacterales bacterium]
MIVDFCEKPPTLRCRGDEDRATQGRRRQALARAFRAQGDVVVDLSELVFADVSLMVDLAMLARRLRGKGRAVFLRGAQPQIVSQIERAGLHRLAGVRVEEGAQAFA